MLARLTFCILITLSSPIYSFDLDDLNYGFSTYLGTGIYSTGEQDVQVYQLPVSYDVYTFSEHGRSLKVNIPITLGFYDFALKDIVATGLPDKVNTLSVQWLIDPALNINEDDIWIVGIRARFTL